MSRRPIATFLALTFLSSSVFYYLIIRSGHMGAGWGGYVGGLMWSLLNFVWTWMRLKTGSIWPGVVLHASHNTFIQTFFDPLTVHNKKTNYVANEFGAGILVASIFLAIYFWRRRAEVEDGSPGNETSGLSRVVAFKVDIAT